MISLSFMSKVAHFPHSGQNTNLPVFRFPVQPQFAHIAFEITSLGILFIISKSSFINNTSIRGRTLCAMYIGVMALNQPISES